MGELNPLPPNPEFCWGQTLPFRNRTDPAQMIAMPPWTLLTDAYKPLQALVAPRMDPAVDKEARAALEALLARVEKLEAGKPSSGFADRFA